MCVWFVRVAFRQSRKSRFLPSRSAALSRGRRQSSASARTLVSPTKSVGTAFGSHPTYVTQCGTKHRTEPHVTYIRAWFRAAGSGPLTYLPPAPAAGRGNTSARTRATELSVSELCVGTVEDLLDGEWVVRSAERAEECVHFLLRHCWVQRHDGGCCATSRWSQCGRELVLLRERAVVGPFHSFTSTATRGRRRTLTYLPPEPSALAVRRPLVAPLGPYSCTYLPPLLGAALTA